MKLRYKYRIYPNKTQEAKLRQFGGSSRYLWNYFLNKQQEQYKETKKFIFYNEMASQLTQLKRTTDHIWLQDVSHQVLQQKLRDLQKALKNCFKYKNGFPKFKSKSNFNDSFRFSQNVKQEGNKTYLEKIGWVKQDIHRKLPSVPSSATIILDGDKWYISYVVEKQEKNQGEIKKVIGLDLGIKEFLVTSDGQTISNPKFLDKSLRQLAKKQQNLSRKQKGSNNRYKQQLVVYNQHKNIRNQRHDFLHQLSNQITNDYDLICTEDLAVANMVQNNRLARSIGQMGWSMFIQMLEYKAKLKGKQTVKIDRFAPSSKTCSACGIKHDITLADRTMKCECGFKLDRDHNAAINICNWGHELYTAGLAEIKACGVDVSLQLSKEIIGAGIMKQECYELDGIKTNTFL